MDNRNKTTILSAVIVVFLVVLFGAMILWTDKIRPEYNLLLVLIIQCFYIVPRLNKAYLKFYGYECSFTSAYIPVINEVSIMLPWIARTVILTTVLAIGTLAFIIIDPSVLGSIFGDIFALRYPTYLANISIVLFVIASIVTGIGYTIITREISTYQDLAYGTKKVQLRGVVRFIYVLFRYLPFLQYILLFFPVLRMVPLMLLTDRIQGLILNNKFFNNIGIKEELEEEISNGFK